MPEANVTVDQWVELFRAIGLEDQDMHKWHVEFERRYPNGHQSFLEWLRMPSAKIADVRRRAAVASWNPVA